MLESRIQSSVVRYAKSKGYIARKFSSQYDVGNPDYIFITPNGIVLFIEFKGSGKKPTQKQELIINLLINQGCLVFVIDNIEDGKRLIDKYLEKSI